MMKRWFNKALILAAVPMLTLSCGSSSDEGDGTTPDNGTTVNDGKGDFSQPLVCEVINGTSRAFDPSTLRDPVAAFLLRLGDCPTTHEAFVEKFQKNHLKPGSGEPAEGEDSVPPVECDRAVESYVVSETAQIHESEDGSSYRVVVSRQCGDTDRHELLWSLFGVSGKGENWNLPAGRGIELMAYDETAGVYNYYEIDGGGYVFHGNSKDILDGTAGRCKGCHVGGGLIMKELDTPWLHWEGHEDIPGAADMVKNNEELLGFKGTGSTFEGITKRGNDQYNKARAEWTMFERSTKDLLRPLFCADEVNLDNAVGFRNTMVSNIPGDFFLARRFTKFNRKVEMPSEVYESMMDEIGSRVPGVNGEFKDTVFRFAFPEQSHIDESFVKVLLSGIDIDGTKVKVLDDELVDDVLSVDFTRPIFNEERCALLQHVPEIDFISGIQAGQVPTQDPLNSMNADAGGGMDNTDGGALNNSFDGGGLNNTAGGCASDADCGGGENCVAGVCEAGGTPGEVNFAQQIRDGLIANLGATDPAEGTAAAELLAALSDADDDHNARIDAFFTACNARDKTEMMRDVARVASVMRKHAMGEHAFEFPQVMTVDNLSDSPDLKFNPETCVAE